MQKKKRRRKGGVNRKLVSKDFKVYLVNIRGANSKNVSLQSIVEDPQVIPDVINLVETKLKISSKLNIEGYKCFNKNRQNKHMGGVATFVRESDVSDKGKIPDDLLSCRVTPPKSRTGESCTINSQLFKHNSITSFTFRNSRIEKGKVLIGGKIVPSPNFISFRQTLF